MISIIICTYNREIVLTECLRHLAQQTDLNFELLLINNNSTDATDALITGFISENPQLNIRYFIEQNQGLSHARNRGVGEAQNEYLVFLDDDAFAFPDYVKNLRSFIAKYPDAQAGGGKITPFWESKQPQWMSHYLLSLVSTIDMGDTIKLFGGRSYPIGANMLIHKSLFDKYGLFNVHLGRNGKNMEGAEEKDLFLRMKKNGIPIYYIPDICVQHWVPDSRLSNEFFSKQSLSIGYSERIRAKNISSVEYIKSITRELFKWGATLILWCLFFAKLQPSKGNKLVLFRINVTRGLLLGKTEILN